MEKKFEFTDECRALFDGTNLHRIRALKSFGGVHEGDLGGWLEKETNLSHEGNAWVYDNALVKDLQWYVIMRRYTGMRVYLSMHV